MFREQLKESQSGAKFNRAKRFGPELYHVQHQRSSRLFHIRVCLFHLTMELIWILLLGKSAPFEKTLRWLQEKSLSPWLVQAPTRPVQRTHPGYQVQAIHVIGNTKSFSLFLSLYISVSPCLSLSLYVSLSIYA